jgi:putative transposase
MELSDYIFIKGKEHEEESIQRGPDRGHSKAAAKRANCCPDYPWTWNQRSHFLQLAAAIWRHGGFRVETDERLGRGKSAFEKKVVGPAQRRQFAHWIVKTKAFSKQRACRLAGLSRRMFAYQSKRQPDSEVEQAVQAIAQRHPGWGFWKIRYRLRRQGYSYNHKRIWRIYRQLGLNLPRRKKKRLPERVRQSLAKPTAINQVWSLDFMSDVLRDGRRFRTLNVLDDYNRQALGIDIDFSLPAKRVVRLLEQAIETHGKPSCLRCDNGPEFISIALTEWCESNEIELRWIQPGKPTQNAYIERFNGTFRREVLNAYLFRNLLQVREVVDHWINDYNTQRPHQALGFLTPNEFKQTG